LDSYGGPWFILFQEPRYNGKQNLLRCNLFHTYGPYLFHGMVQPSHCFRISKNLKTRRKTERSKEKKHSIEVLQIHRNKIKNPNLAPMPVKKKHRTTKSAKEHFTFFNSKRRGERKKKCRPLIHLQLQQQRKNKIWIKYNKLTSPI